MTDRSKTVVMLIDWDNLQICHSRDAPGTELDLQALIALAQSYGTLVSARAYAEWNLLSERLAVYKAGIEPVFAPVMRPEGSPREGKSLADTVMVADGVDLLWTVAPDVFVLATSDKDMIPLARIAKQRGAAVVVLGSDLTAIPLVEMSNVFITYRQLLRELDRVTELEAPVGRAPARERRLRESRRPSSEPYGGGLGSGVSSTPIGAGGRSGPRPMGAMSAASSPVAPLPPAAPVRRRISESVAPPPAIESERALPEPVAPTAISTDDGAEPLGVGAGDVGPRRRRRRGGRGRRAGLGGVGEGDLQGAALGDNSEQDEDGEATGDASVTAAASASPPDDIDSAVLELLASRDRDAGSAAASESPVVEEPAESARPAAFSAPTWGSSSAAPAASATSEPVAPHPRVARTSFSSFGPPDAPARQLEQTPAPVGPVEADLSESPAASSEPASSPSEMAAVVTMPDAVAPDLDPVTDGEPASGDDASQPTAEAPASGATRSSRSSRSGRSSQGGTARSRTRRTPSSAETASASGNGSAETAPAAPAEASAPDGGEAARPARRRRTRRPSSGSSDGAEAAVSEAGV